MRALILVDLQNDFMPGGALEVPQGDAVVPPANEVKQQFDFVVATQDWHPADHASFAANHKGRQPGEVIMLDEMEQILWPVHCVQGTPGASFHSALDVSKIDAVFQKGMDPRVDSYSGFFDNDHRHSTGMSGWLNEHGVTAVYILGLALEYCVKFTALDAVKEGFGTYLIEDACRGVELNTGDIERAFYEMHEAGVHSTSCNHVLMNA